MENPVLLVVLLHVLLLGRSYLLPFKAMGVSYGTRSSKNFKKKR